PIMLRASLLADAEILPQARQGSYFFNRIGRLLPVTSGRNRPILLKKSVRPNSLVIDWLKRLFCTLLREI
ncbi:hypothetical protein J1G35_29740, partial [Pseudomonas sp. SH10-3B]|uniref:hypothetical protein n=1 Tax=Pseudomonas sp. SH10-3B TaxID=2816049 RepID=UPI001CA6AD05